MSQRPGGWCSTLRSRLVNAIGLEETLRQEISNDSHEQALALSYLLLCILRSARALDTISAFDNICL